MSWRNGSRDRRDANEPQIRAALHAVGARTWPISGKDLPDLLVWFGGREFVMEIKSDRGKHRKDEAHVGVPWPVVTSVDEAMAVILRVEARNQ